jgi:AmmeMemoRadiSam system protein A
MRDDTLGRQLLGVARGAIAGELSLAALAPVAGRALQRHGATFVTLFSGGDLRGCIGSLKATRALEVDVRENALAAAFRDPRFPPLTAAEFPMLSIEVSLLSYPEHVSFATEDELCTRLVPGIDGVAFELSGCHATFLPQVWESLPEPRAFLVALKAKAGLPADFWSPKLNVSLYRVTKWKESELLSMPIAS